MTKVVSFNTFKELFAKILEEEVIKKNKDGHIAILGHEGSGKSNLALALALHLKNRLKKYGYEFDLYKNVVFTETTFLNRFAKEKQIIVVDEAGAIFSTFSARTKEQKESLIEIILGRVRQNLVFYCTPSLRWFDPYFREHRINMAIIAERDRAYAYTEKYSTLVDLIKEYGIKVKDVTRMPDFDFMIYDVEYLGKTNPEFWKKYNELKKTLNAFYHIKRRLKLKNDYAVIEVCRAWLDGDKNVVKNYLKQMQIVELERSKDLQEAIQFVFNDKWEIIKKHFGIDDDTNP